MLSSNRRRRDEDITSALTRTIGAIDVVKGVVPIQIAQGILGTTLAILIVIKVSWVLLFLSLGCNDIPNPFEGLGHDQE
jgi:hypothetical protein